MPNAIVATTTTPSSRRNRSCVLRRSPASRPAWYGSGVHAVRGEERGDLLGARAREGVDDARDRGARRQSRRPSLRTKSSSCLRTSSLGAMRYWMLGRSKLDTKCLRAVEREARRDLAMRGLGGRGREGDARHVGPALGELGEREVVGAEVVAPLRDAVRLVDREQGDAAALEEPLRGLGVEPLGRDVEQVELAGEVGALDPRPFGRLLAGVQVGGAHAVAHEGVDLVVHERDERRHHHARALAQQRRDLVAEALAAAGRHEHDRVAAARDLRDDLGLLAAERVVAEDGVQRLGGRGEARRRGADDARHGRRGRRRGARRRGGASPRPAPGSRSGGAQPSSAGGAQSSSAAAGARRDPRGPRRGRGIPGSSSPVECNEHPRRVSRIILRSGDAPRARCRWRRRRPGARRRRSTVRRAATRSPRHPTPRSSRRSTARACSPRRRRRAAAARERLRRPVAELDALGRLPCERPRARDRVPVGRDDLPRHGVLARSAEHHLRLGGGTGHRRCSRRRSSARRARAPGSRRRPRPRAARRWSRARRCPAARSPRRPRPAPTRRGSCGPTRAARARTTRAADAATSSAMPADRALRRCRGAPAAAGHGAHHASERRAASRDREHDAHDADDEPADAEHTGHRVGRPARGIRRRRGRLVVVAVLVGGRSATSSVAPP